MADLDFLAEKILQTKVETLPAGLLGPLKMSLADLIAVSILGASDPNYKVLEKSYLPLSKGVDEKGGVKVWGSGYSLPLRDAVYLNGCMSHILDFDDTGASSQGHPSAVLFPALLGIAENEDKDFSAVIEAYMVGVEVLTALSKSVPNLHLFGWHPSSVLGVVANAAACSKLLSLDKVQIKNALSLSCSFTGGVVTNFGSLAKPVHIGNTNVNGLTCAYLAKGGVSGSKEVFEKAPTFFSILTNGGHTSFSERLKCYGNPYSLEEYGLNIKRYPSCSISHRGIDIAVDLRSRPSFNLEEVDRIVFRAPPRAKKILRFDRPDEPLNGKFCMPFLLACSLKYGNVTSEMFQTAYTESPEIQYLMDKVDFAPHGDWVDGANDWRPDVLLMAFKDGSTLKGEAVYPKGHAKNPLTWEGFRVKFNGCMVKKASAERDSLFIKIKDLDLSWKVKSLTNLL